MHHAGAHRVESPEGVVGSFGKTAVGRTGDQSFRRPQDGVVLLRRERSHRRFRSEGAHRVRAVLSAARAVGKVIRTVSLEHPRALNPPLVRVFIPVAGALPGEALWFESHKLHGLAERSCGIIGIEFHNINTVAGGAAPATVFMLWNSIPIIP